MATITEDYVSFETAKLLKEKGFNPLECGMYYSITTGKKTTELLTSLIACPTLQMAMKWLREIHNIAINIGWGEVLEDKFQWWCIILSIKDGSILRESEYYATYEQACEVAIKYCLENLENLI